MKTKKKKHQHARGEVMELARETAKVEQYWIVGDRSEPHKPPKNYDYVEELIHLQIELIKLQEYVRHNHLKMCVIFEGRDAAGKGGVIKRITDPLNPRVCRVVALATPTEKERGQWYFQSSVPNGTPRATIEIDEELGARAEPSPCWRRSGCPSPLASPKFTSEQQKALGTADRYKEGDASQSASVQRSSGGRMALHRTAVISCSDSRGE
jgi:Polyphosphate kinase 2 (PPK2)